MSNLTPLSKYSSSAKSSRRQFTGTPATVTLELMKEVGNNLTKVLILINYRIFIELY